MFCTKCGKELAANCYLSRCSNFCPAGVIARSEATWQYVLFIVTNIVFVTFLGDADSHASLRTGSE